MGLKETIDEGETVNFFWGYVLVALILIIGFFIFSLFG